jgi:hypothetical protein
MNDRIRPGVDDGSPETATRFDVTCESCTYSASSRRNPVAILLADTHTALRGPGHLCRIEGPTRSGPA